MSIELFDLKYYDLYQGLLTLFIIILGLVPCLLLSDKKSDIKYIFSLYIWHTAFSIYYWYFSLSNTADATLYYQKTFSLILDFSPGTRFTEAVAYIIARSLNANYLNTTLASNIFGSLGLVFLYLSLKKYLFTISRYWIMLLFIPSMSFWSAGLGKDSISFMAACLFVYAIVSSKKIAMGISFIAMFMVRPHIAFMMLTSFIIYFISRSKAHILIKILTLPIILASAIIALKFVQQYVGLGDVSLEGLESYVDKRQGYNQSGGSSLDIASMSYPMQMFTYIFRPLPFEAHSIVALITSIENTILLLLFTYIVIKTKFKIHAFIVGKNLWLFIYFFLTCTILALTTANLGIATRQKWMFMPALLYLLVFSYHDYKIKKQTIQ